jgi:DNA-binding transcriptional regulator YiaG
MTFKTEIRRYLKRHELSANKAAKLLGKTSRTIFLWKSGDSQPTIPQRKRLFKITGGELGKSNGKK